MGKIIILDENLINKIAAGEVIERPASIVKELIDNSIDAGADEISVFVEKSGKRLIKIIDNGCGMDEEDLFLSVERHATSKIKETSDLFKILTHGFRGEALASIAAVSKLTAASRQKNSLEGNQIVVVGGQMKEKNIAGLSTGTEITVENLFFNTPVRKKFLKTESTELAHILNIITNHSMAYPYIHFKLYSENKIIFESVKHGSRLDSILDIFGHSLKKDIVSVNDELGDLKLEAYLGSPNISRKSKDRQKIYVNNRFIRNSTITSAVYNVYKTLLTIGEHPVFIIFLDINPENIDVNVHPTKNEVRFTDNQHIMYNIETMLKKGMMKSPFMSPRVTLKSYKISDLSEKAEINTETLVESKPENINIIQTGFFSKKNSEQSGEKKFLPVKPDNSETAEIGLINYDSGIKNETGYSRDINIEKKVLEENNNGKEDVENEKNNSLNKNENIPNFKIIGQAGNLYIIVELDTGIKIIDQHAAHERILYNKFMNSVKNKDSVDAQLLLIPLNIEVTQSEKIILNDWIPVLNKLGFEMEEFGANSYLIRSMPVFSGMRTDDKRVLLDLIDDIISLGKIRSYDEMIHNIIAMMACRTAVKAGSRLMPGEMKEIAEKILTDNSLSSCPHGRPTSLDITFDGLEKNFKRKK